MRVYGRDRLGEEYTKCVQELDFDTIENRRLILEIEFLKLIYDKNHLIGFPKKLPQLWTERV